MKEKIGEGGLQNQNLKLFPVKDTVKENEKTRHELGEYICPKLPQFIK